MAELSCSGLSDAHLLRRQSSDPLSAQAIPSPPFELSSVEQQPTDGLGSSVRPKTLIRMLRCQW